MHLQVRRGQDAGRQRPQAHQQARACGSTRRKTEIPRVFGGLGIAILSTSRGIMTGSQARKLNLGGEVLCYVW